MSFRIIAPLTAQRNTNPNAGPVPQPPQDAQQARRRRPRPGEPVPPRAGN